MTGIFSYWSAKSDKIDYLVKVSENGELVMHWNEICEALKQLNNKSHGSIGFVSVVGHPGSGKTTIMNKMMESAKFPSKLAFPSKKPDGQPDGILVRLTCMNTTVPKSASLFCLDIVSDGTRPEVYAKLVRFCTLVSSSLIVMYGGFSKVWKNSDFTKIFFPHVNAPLPRKVAIVHKTLICNNAGTAKIKPAYKCTQSSWVGKKAPEPDRESMAAFMDSLSTIFDVCHSFVPSESITPPREAKDGLNLFETALQNVPPIIFNGLKLCHPDWSSTENYLREKCDLANVMRQIEDEASRPSSLSANLANQVMDSINTLLENSSLALCSTTKEGSFKRDYSRIPLEQIEKFLQDIQSLPSIPTMESEGSYSSNPKANILGRTTPAYPSSHSGTRSMQDVSAIFKSAVTEYLLQFCLALLQGYSLSEAVPNTRLDNIVSNLNAKVNVQETLKKDLEAKFLAFSNDFLRVHAQLSKCEAELNAITAKDICIKPDSLRTKQEEMVDGAVATIQISSEDARGALLSVLKSTSALLFSRFNSINTANVGYEIILVDQALQHSLRIYVFYMAHFVRTCYFSRENFKLVHSHLVRSLLDSFQPPPPVFPTSFIWKQKLNELEGHLTKYFHEYDKINAQNTSRFEIKRQDIISKALAVYMNEASRPGPKHTFTKQSEAKILAIQTFESLTTDESENNIIIFRAALNEAISDLQSAKDSNSSRDVPYSADHQSSTQLAIASYGDRKDNSVTQRMKNASSSSSNLNHPLVPPVTSYILPPAMPMDYYQSYGNVDTKVGYLGTTSSAVVELDSLKSQIAYLVNQLDEKLKSSSDIAERFRNYIIEQIQEAKDLLQNSSATSFQLSKIRMKLENTLE